MYPFNSCVQLARWFSKQGLVISFIGRDSRSSFLWVLMGTPTEITISVLKARCRLTRHYWRVVLMVNKKSLCLL